MCVLLTAALGRVIADAISSHDWHWQFPLSRDFEVNGVFNKHTRPSLQWRFMPCICILQSLLCPLILTHKTNRAMWCAATAWIEERGTRPVWVLVDQIITSVNLPHTPNRAYTYVNYKLLVSQTFCLSSSAYTFQHHSSIGLCIQSLYSKYVLVFVEELLILVYSKV